MTDLALLTAAEQARLIRAKKVSPVEVMGATLQCIADLNPKLNAFITLLDDDAARAARDAEAAVVRGDRLGRLHGVPVGLKDNFETRGIRTTAGSRVLENNVPDRDATVVERLRGAGAIIVGKTHLNEFALGPVVFGEVHNPWDLTRSPGGSSCGSAVAVAAGMCPVAMGHDTGGSIRLPASLCGVVGLKPTYGRVSRYGVIPLAQSMDHAGPMCRTAEDAALVLSVIAGYDPRDSTSSETRVPSYARAIRGGIRGLRIGLPKELFFDVMDAEVKRGVHVAVETLKALGASVTDVSVPLAVRVEEFGHTIMLAEAVANQDETMRSSPEKYGPSFLAQLRSKQGTTAVEYIKARDFRRALREQFLLALRDIDVLVTPTTPIPAPPLGQRSYSINGKPVTASYAMAGFTRPFNLARLPAVSIPCGFTEGGLPIGLQIAGKPFDEATVLRAAHAFQQHTDWHTRRPLLEIRD